MATARVTISEGLSLSDDVDHAKIAATTEEDVQRYMREDGEVPNGEPIDDLPNVDGDGEQGTARVTAAYVRARTGLSQSALSETLGLPVATWRNWEQGRTRIEPAALALITLLSADPGGVLATIRKARAEGRTAVSGR